ncbi:hypothetical protein [Burkholderia ubonensis]|uniref:hypothetical protein n=1 Tax=Burkholderia ubonensis TaxID=101571 RepID=UPI0011605DA8|nr:hypothetical protein [Burkholderia ubonensis]
MKQTCLKLFAIAAALATTSTLSTAAPLGDNPCGVKSQEEALREAREAIYCGDDAACIARETAALPAAMRAHNCEMQRLTPSQVLNAGPAGDAGSPAPIR